MEVTGSEERSNVAGEPSTTPRESERRGFVSYLMKIVGKTVGLAQKAGKKSATDVIKAGRKAGKALQRRSSPSDPDGTRKEKQKELDRLTVEIDQVRSEVRPLFNRIGKRFCALCSENSRLASVDPQIEALVSTALARELHYRGLKERAEALSVELSQPALAANAAEQGTEAGTEPGEAPVGHELETADLVGTGSVGTGSVDTESGQPTCEGPAYGSTQPSGIEVKEPSLPSDRARGTDEPIVLAEPRPADADLGRDLRSTVETARWEDPLLATEPVADAEASAPEKPRDPGMGNPVSGETGGGMSSSGTDRTAADRRNWRRKGRL